MLFNSLIDQNGPGNSLYEEYLTNVMRLHVLATLLLKLMAMHACMDAGQYKARPIMPCISLVIIMYMYIVQLYSTSMSMHETQ